MVKTVKPKANATPTNPIPRLGKAAARTALPQPPSTSQSVPMNSAASFCGMPVPLWREEVVDDSILYCSWKSSQRIFARPPAPLALIGARESPHDPDHDIRHCEFLALARDDYPFRAQGRPSRRGR